MTVIIKNRYFSLLLLMTYLTAQAKDDNKESVTSKLQDVVKKLKD